MISNSHMDSAGDLVERVKAAGIEVIHLQFVDVPGSIKSLTIPASRLERTLETGAWFDGSSVEGLARSAESDLFLRPDPSSFAILPWESTPKPCGGASPASNITLCECSRHCNR